MRRPSVLAALAVAAAALVTGCADETTVQVTVTVRAATEVPAVSVPPATAPADTAAAVTTPPPATATSPPVTPTTAAPGVERPADFPTPAEADLIGRLPDGTARRCTRTSEENTSRGATASLFCDLTDLHGVTTYFETFPDRPTMLGVYGNLRRGQEVRSDVRRCDRPGVRLPGEGPWTVGGQGSPRGRLMCFRDGSRFWYVWTQDDVLAMGWASGERLPRVREYWINDSDIRAG